MLILFVVGAAANKIFLVEGEDGVPVPACEIDEDMDLGAGDLRVKDIDKLSLIAFNLARMRLTVAKIYESAEKNKREAMEMQLVFERERFEHEKQNQIEGFEYEKLQVEKLKLQLELARLQSQKLG